MSFSHHGMWTLWTKSLITHRSHTIVWLCKVSHYQWSVVQYTEVFPQLYEHFWYFLTLWSLSTNNLQHASQTNSDIFCHDVMNIAMMMSFPPHLKPCVTFNYDSRGNYIVKQIIEHEKVFSKEQAERKWTDNGKMCINMKSFSALIFFRVVLSIIKIALYCVGL